MKKPAKTQEVMFSEDVVQASGVAVSDCVRPGCPCSNLAILFYDEDKEVFAYMRLSPHASEQLGLKLVEAARAKIGGRA